MQTVERGDTGKLAAALRLMNTEERHYKGMLAAADRLAGELESAQATRNSIRS
jgi:hypothetical protein